MLLVCNVVVLDMVLGDWDCVGGGGSSMIISSSSSSSSCWRERMNLLLHVSHCLMMGMGLHTVCKLFTGH